MTAPRDTPIRVLQWTTGNIGRRSLHAILARPDLELGVCGEHAGDPASIRFLAECGVDYVSCSPPRVPVARLEAGRAAVLQQGVTASDSR